MRKAESTISISEMQQHTKKLFLFLKPAPLYSRIIN